MIAVRSSVIPSGNLGCVPPDEFWEKNRALAELIWRRGDGATVSTCVSEDVQRVTGVAASTVKTTFHAALAAGLGIVGAYVVSCVTDEPALRVAGIAGSAAVAYRAFRYLENDRC